MPWRRVVFVCLSVCCGRAYFRRKFNVFFLPQVFAQLTFCAQSLLPRRLAPEVLLNQGNYDSKADVFSYGIWISELASGCEFFFSVAI